jgi:hypothetical protein
MSEGEWRSVGLGRKGGAFFVGILSAAIMLIGIPIFVGWMLLLDPLPPLGILGIVAISAVVLLHQAILFAWHLYVTARTAKEVIVRNGEARLVLFTNRPIPLREFTLSRIFPEQYFKYPLWRLFPRSKECGVIWLKGCHYYLPGDMNDFDSMFNTLARLEIKSDHTSA